MYLKINLHVINAVVVQNLNPTLHTTVCQVHTIIY